MQLYTTIVTNHLRSGRDSSHAFPQFVQLQFPLEARVAFLRVLAESIVDRVRGVLYLDPRANGRRGLEGIFASRPGQAGGESS